MTKNVPMVPDVPAGAIAGIVILLIAIIVAVVGAFLWRGEWMIE